MEGELTAALVGALIGGLITAVAQWFLTPRIERHSRSLERWEQDVLSLGRLLSDEFWQAREDARHALDYVVMLREGPQGEKEAPRWQEFVEAKKREQRDAFSVYFDLINVRMKWLVDRVGSRRTDEAEAVARRYITYFINTPVLIRFDEDSYSAEQIDEAWEKERAAFTALTEAVKLAADQLSPPGRPPHRKVVRSLRRWHRKDTRTPEAIFSYGRLCELSASQAANIASCMTAARAETE